MKELKNDEVKGEGLKRRRYEKRGEKNRDSQTGMKRRRTENKNALPLSVILCICLTQQSGSESSSSLSYKRAVTYSSALHSLATEGR